MHRRSSVVRSVVAFVIGAALLPARADAQVCQVTPAPGDCGGTCNVASGSCTYCEEPFTVSGCPAGSAVTSFGPGCHTTFARCSGGFMGVGVVCVNPQPTIECPPDQVLACGATSPPPRTSDCAGEEVVCTPSAPSGMCATPQTCTVTNSFGGGSASCSYCETVAPSNPVITPTAAAPELWPPNHKYHPVSLRDCVANVTACGQTLDVMQFGVITRVESDEYEESKFYCPRGASSSPDCKMTAGDAHTCNDIVIVGNTTVLLRAERSGSGNGRVYTIHFTVGSPEGGSTPGTCQVRVPHDQSGRPAVRDACLYCEGPGCVGCPTHHPACTF